MIEACDVWEDMLLDNPLDMLATRFAHDSYFYLGLSVPMRDSLARILPEWKESFPLYGYVYHRKPKVLVYYHHLVYVYLCVCVCVCFQQSFSHITTEAACYMRRDSARALSTANTDALCHIHKVHVHNPVTLP